MASSFNLTIDDSSPLISYGPSGAWQDASSNLTAGLGYNANTFHSTSASSATATINFNGTGIEIYGGHRPEYGTYTLTVDGQTVASGSATGSAVASQQLLGSATNLSNGPHTAVLTSTGTGMDIDWANLLTQIGPPGATVTSKVFDDASPSMNYAGDWKTVTGNAAYTDGTLHYTQSPGAAASLGFNGSAFAIYGTVSPDHNNIQVSLDGQITLINTQAPSISSLHPQTLLYYADGLDSSQHVLIIANPSQGSGSGPFVDVDSIMVYSAASTSADDTAPAASISKSPKPAASGLPTGAIVGIALAVILAVAAILGLILFLFVRRKRRRRGPVDPATPIDAELPWQEKMGITPDTPIQPLPTFTRLAHRMSISMSRQSMAHSIAPSYYAFSAPGQSFGTTTPMSQQSRVSKVPTLAMPKMPSRAQQGMTMTTTGDKPRRPP